MTLVGEGFWDAVVGLEKAKLLSAVAGPSQRNWYEKRISVSLVSCPVFSQACRKLANFVDG